jgi:hypothetical protein
MRVPPSRNTILMTLLHQNAILASEVVGAVETLVGLKIPKHYLTQRPDSLIPSRVREAHVICD